MDLLIDAHAEAFETLAAQAADHPSFPDVQHRLGLLYYLVGVPENAIEAHERALAINPDYIAAASALGYALERAGYPERAIAHWQQVLGGSGRSALQSERAGIALDLAMAFGRRDESDRGIKLLESLNDVGPQRHLIARERFLLFALARRNAEAGEELDRLVRANPLFESYFAELGLLTAKGRTVAAIRRWMTTREANHNLAEIHFYLGFTFAAFGDRVKAEDELRAAWMADFDLAAYHAQRGRQRSLFGEMEEAAEDFAAAIAADPDHVRARIDLGSELAALGRIEEAIEHFEAAVRLEPRYADVHYQLGLLFEQMGQLESAEHSLTRALRINPNFALARASLALLCSRSGRDEEALVHYERTLRAGLRSADIYLSMALIHSRRGDLARAAEALRSGARVNPRYAPIHYHLGRIYQQRGQRGRAYAAWRRFLHCAEEPEFSERLDRFKDELSREGAAGFGAPEAEIA